MPEGNLFAATALAGYHDRARGLIPTVVAKLPVPGRRNVQGVFWALEAFVTGLSIIGNCDESRTLYPATVDYLHKGQVLSYFVTGPAIRRLPQPGRRRGRNDRPIA